MLAQFKSSYEGGLAQFRASYAPASVAITVVTDIDAGNVDSTKVVITAAESAEPTVFVDYRTATGGWRHLLWAVENAEGKRPVFQLNWASRVSTAAPTSDWAILWTQDFITWTKAPSRTLVDGVMTCQFTDPLPAGRVYVATQPMWPQSGADSLATELLTTYSSVASPTASADVNGVYNVSPTETDENSRAIGAHEQYSIKLEFGGSTTDGGPKRRLVMLSGIHAAGEGHAHTAFRAALLWMLNSATPEAIAFRANWDVYCYFNLTPNGYYGGHNRTNFRVSTDPNRNWDTGSLSEIAAVKTAISTDLGLGSGGRWDAMFSWHAFYQTTGDFQAWVTPADASAGTRTPAMQAMLDNGATVFDNAVVLDNSGTSNTDVWWAKSQGALVAFDTELQQSGDTDPAFFESVAQKWMRTLQLTDAAGVFWQPVSLSAPTVTDITTTSVRPQVTITNAAAGTLRYAIYPAAASAPTFDGTTWSGSPVVTGSEASITTDGTQTFASAATGLDPATDYKIAFVWEDGVDQSAVAWSDLWTTLAATIELAAQNSDQPATSAAGAIEQTHQPAGAASDQPATSTSASIAQTHVLGGTDSDQAATAQAGAASQTHTLAGANSEQPSTAQPGAASQTHALAGANSEQPATATSGEVSVVFTHILGGTNSEQPATSAAGAAQQTHALGAIGSDQAIVVTSGALAQTHVFGGANSEQRSAAQAGAIDLSFTHILSAGSSEQPATSTADGIAHTHTLQSPGSAADSTASASAIVQQHLLTGADSEQRATVTARAIFDGLMQDPALLRSVYVRLGRDEPTIRITRDEPFIRLETNSTTTRI